VLLPLRWKTAPGREWRGHANCTSLIVQCRTATKSGVSQWPRMLKRKRGSTVALGPDLVVLWGWVPTGQPRSNIFEPGQAPAFLLYWRCKERNACPFSPTSKTQEKVVLLPQQASSPLHLRLLRRETKRNIQTRIIVINTLTYISCIFWHP